MSRQVLCLLLSLLSLLQAGPLHAEPAAMTRDAIIELVKPAVGHGYYFGHNTWTSDGSRKGTCSGNCTTSCTFSGTIGTDCSGLVSKAWQVPTAIPLTTDKGHFSTELFRHQELYWKRIQRSELQRGDALVYRNAANTAGHIVLFDRLSNDSRAYWVYEARGCRDGVVYNLRDLGADYIAIRRTGLIESAPVTCGVHGRPNGLDGCSCDPGYGGADCAACASGHYGFPSCVREGSACEPMGSLQCGDAVAVRPFGGESWNSSYSCSDTGVDGSEVVYEFRPRGRGKAKLGLESTEGELQLLALKQQCDAKSCVGADPGSLSLDYSEGDVFYIAVESRNGSTSEGKLTVNCEVPKQAWVGDPCQTNADCDLSHHPEAGARGFCFQQGEASFCSLPCERLCPDLVPDKAETFCAENPSATTGMCVSRSERQNAACADIPGTVELRSERFSQPGVQELACVPTPSSACSGIVAGSVEEFEGSPIKAVAGATIRIEAAGVLKEVRSDESGNYQSPPLPCGAVALSVAASGFLPERLSIEVTGDQTQQTRLKALPLACTGHGAIAGNVSDAVLNTPVANARIELYASLGRALGTPVASTTSDSLGNYEFTQLEAGNYTALTEAPGYGPFEAAVIACGGTTQSGNNFFLSLASPSSLTFALAWKQPADLDLHLQLPNGEEVYFDDLCRGSAEAFPYATLEVDHRFAEGPEVLRVSALLPGRYTLFVHNYSQDFDPSEPGLADSDAEVLVFGAWGRLLGRFPVPTRGTGLHWDVLSFEGLRPDTLIPIQRLNAERPRPESYVQACRP